MKGKDLKKKDGIVSFDEKNEEAISEEKDKKEDLNNSTVELEKTQIEENKEDKSKRDSCQEKDENQKKDKHQEQKVEEKENYLEDLQRLQAEFENFRKRTAKEKAQIKEFVAEEILTNLLPVFDNFNRAIESFEKAENLPSTFVEGVKMIYTQLKSVFEKYGVQEINAVGEKFNPEIHEAVGTEEADEEGIVLKELQKGYKIGNRVVRPSSVIVSKKKKEVSSSSGSDSET